MPSALFGVRISLIFFFEYSPHRTRQSCVSSSAVALSKSAFTATAMKTSLRHLALVALLGLTGSLTSCVTPYPGPGERNGAVVGAIGGGTLGAIVGNQSGRPLEGAAIGGVLGALAGSALGANQDHYYGYRQPAYYPTRADYGPRYYRRSSFYGGGGYYGGGYPCGPAFGGGYGYGSCW